MDNFNDLLSTRYLKDTKYSRDNINEPKPFVMGCSTYKTYPTSKKLPLNKNFVFPTASLENCLRKRRSIRRYERRPLKLDEISALLWATQGITAQMGGYFLRTAPSAGALYPIETYLIINFSEDMEQGVYHFNPIEFSLEELKKGDFSEKISSSCLGQTFLKHCPVVFVWSSVTRRCAAKYTNRAMRYIMMDVGHICENLLLACVAFGMGACPVAAFFDDEANEIIGVDGNEESVIYLASTGYPKE